LPTSFGEDVLATIARISRACEAVAVPWAVGGSFASGLYGEPRATNDVDVIACLRLGDVRPFVAALGDEVYVDADVIREAIAGCRSFNVLDERTFMKIDVFVPPRGPLGEGQLQRRRRLELAEGVSTWVLGPEDVLLQKLAWYRLGGEQSDRQWRDICAILRMSRTSLDHGYLEEVARGTGLDGLLERAKLDAAV
jgi:hypothetical protein